MNSFGERAQGLALFRSFEIDEERGVEQDRFPLPEAGERVPLGARGGDVGGAEGMEPQAEFAAYGGGERALAAARVAAQLDDGPLTLFRIDGPEAVDDAEGVGAVRDRECARPGDRLDETLEAFVERGSAHQMMHDALVGPQAPRRQRLTREQFDEMPAA